MAHGKRKRDSIHETPDVSYITNPDVAHEQSDVSVAPLLKFVAGLVIFTITVCFAMWLMFKFFDRREEAAELETSPLARQGDERLPPEPRLQLAPGFGVTSPDGTRVPLSYDAIGKTERTPQPQSEYWAVRDQWDKELHDYGWADQQAGTVRVPIERAMQIYAERQQAGQKQPAAQPGQPAAPQSAPSEITPSASSSGQQPERRQQ